MATSWRPVEQHACTRQWLDNFLCWNIADTIAVVNFARALPTKCFSLRPLTTEWWNIIWEPKWTRKGQLLLFACLTLNHSHRSGWSNLQLRFLASTFRLIILYVVLHDCMHIATTTVTTICSYYSDGPLFDVLEQYHIPPPTTPTQNNLGITNILLATNSKVERSASYLRGGIFWRSASYLKGGIFWRSTSYLKGGIFWSEWFQILIVCNGMRNIR